MFIWELGYDLPATNTNPQSLLNKIWATNTTSPNNGYPNVTITAQPAVSTTVVPGYISGSLSVGTDKSCIDAIYQWYSNTSNSNIGGTLLSGKTGANFPIPSMLAANSTYYYFCEVKSGRSTVRSNVATVTVTPYCMIIFSTAVTSNTTIYGCPEGLTIQNVTVSNGAKLTVVSNGYAVFLDNFEVELGSEFEVQ